MSVIESPRLVSIIRRAILGTAAMSNIKTKCGVSMFNKLIHGLQHLLGLIMTAEEAVQSVLS
jgi:hypothetical protein